MPGMSSPLEIQVSVCGDARTVYLTGELDLAGVPELRAMLACVIPDAHEVVIDLEQLEFMDSSGLRCLLECQESCQRSQTRCRLTPGKRQVMRLFEIACVLDRLQFTRAITVGSPTDGQHA